MGDRKGLPSKEFDRQWKEQRLYKVVRYGPVNPIDFDKLTLLEIYEMIEADPSVEKDVIAFYNNEWWDDTP